MLADWQEDYGGNLLVILPDTYGTSGFLANAPDWEKWYRDNDPYLVWSDRRNHLIVDDEAKRARIPTEQFRKNHPWAENP